MGSSNRNHTVISWPSTLLWCNECTDMDKWHRVWLQHHIRRNLYRRDLDQRIDHSDFWRRQRAFEHPTRLRAYISGQWRRVDDIKRHFRSNSWIDGWPP